MNKWIFSVLLAGVAAGAGQPRGDAPTVGIGQAQGPAPTWVGGEL